MDENNQVNFIAIEGVIGAGKTSLAKKIKERLKAELILEQFDVNPFLEKFYGDRKRYAFQTQMFFLINRYKQQQELNQENLFTEFLVSDYLFEKDRIFAYLNLNGEELKLYESIFPLLSRNLRKPDLVIYLQSGVERLMYNIKKRSRKIERNLTRSYIEELSDAYNHFFFRYTTTPLLIVNSTDIDFVSSDSKSVPEGLKIEVRDQNGKVMSSTNTDKNGIFRFKNTLNRSQEGRLKMIMEFIFYVVLFYIIIKSLNALVRWWNTPGMKKKQTTNQGESNSSYSKYKDVEEAEFTEIKTDHKKEKA